MRALGVLPSKLFVYESLKGAAPHATAAAFGSRCRL